MGSRVSSATAAGADSASPASSQLSMKMVEALTERTPVEESKLRRRPQEWRLACQALVDRSLLVLTRPQVRLPDAEARLAAARRSLPDGPRRGQCRRKRSWRSRRTGAANADEEAEASGAMTARR